MIFNQLLRTRDILRMASHASARDVHMSTTAVLIGPEQCHRKLRIFDQQAAKVIGVHDTDLALASSNRFQQSGVIREDIGSQIGDPAFDDGFCFRLADSLIIIAISDWL
jgi:hypothetical protein